MFPRCSLHCLTFGASVFFLPPYILYCRFLQPLFSFSIPSVPAAVLFYPFPLLCWSLSHTITASPSLLSSFRHMSLGAIHPASTFYGPNPFSHCVFTGLGAGIDLPVFVSPITRFLFLSLTCSLSCCSPTDGLSHSLFPLLFTQLTFSFPTFYFVPFLISALFCFPLHLFILSIPPPPLSSLSFSFFHACLSLLLTASLAQSFLLSESHLIYFACRATFMDYNSFIQYVSRCMCACV